MKKLRFLGLLLVVLALSLAFIACNGGTGDAAGPDTGSGGDDRIPWGTSVGSGNKGGSLFPTPSPTAQVLTFTDGVYTIEITENLSRAAYQPKSGDLYKVYIFEVLISEGTVTIGSTSSSGTITLIFTPSDPPTVGYTFTATFSENGVLEITGGKIKDKDGNDHTIPPLSSETYDLEFTAEQFKEYFSDGESAIYNTPGTYTITLKEDLIDFSGASLKKAGVNIIVKGDVASRRITFKYSDSSGHSIFSIEGGKLTLENIKLSRSEDDDKADFPLLWAGGIDYRGTIEIKNGVEVSNNNGIVPAPGVWLYTGKFIMSGGTITNCTTGVGASVADKASIEIIGGTISDNEAPGILLLEESENCTVTISGGTISGNRGSGVEIYGVGNTFTMSGGVISKNSDWGLILSGANSEFVKQSGAIIYGNTGDNKNGSGAIQVYLGDNNPAPARIGDAGSDAVYAAKINAAGDGIVPGSQKPTSW